MKHLLFLFLISALTSCGGSSSGKPLIDDGLSPNESADPTSDFSYIKTLEAALDLDPHEFDFSKGAPISQGKPAIQSFTIINRTGTDYKIHLNVVAPTGGFNLVEKEGVYTSVLAMDLAKNKTSEAIKLRYNAAVVGIRSGYIELTVDGVEGFIRAPFKAAVDVPKNFRVLGSDFLCVDNKAPILTGIDFDRVATGRSEIKKFKICNTSETPIQIHQIRFRAYDGENKSIALTQSTFEKFPWNLHENLDTNYFQYDNPSFTQPLDEESLKKEEHPTVPVINMLDAFRVTAKVNGEGKSPSGVVVSPTTTDPANVDLKHIGFLNFEVEFKPALDFEPRENRASPVAYSAFMDLETSAGIYTVELLGASGGKEPILKIVPGIVGQEPPACDAAGLDTHSQNLALFFDKPVSIFEKWIPEDRKSLSIRLCNMGTGGKPLKIWTNPFTKGYFSYGVNTPTFPLSINPGESAVLEIRHNPTPMPHESLSTWDFGQLIFSHNGGNGPKQPLILIGSRVTSRLIEITQNNGSTLKSGDFYTRSGKEKNLQCVKATGESIKTFTVENRSINYTLSSNLQVRDVKFFDKDKREIANTTQVTVMPSSLNLTPENKGNFDFKIQANNLPDGTKITGRLVITNRMSVSTSLQPPQYEVPFKMTASTSGECEGAAAGQPLNDQVTMVIDRITMILPGGLNDPARNPPAFKFHFPLDLNLENRWVRAHGLDYDPTQDIVPTRQIRSYAHQLSNVSGCHPLPTNPYLFEFEEGSWDGPRQCNYAPQRTGEAAKWKPVVGKSVCIANNGTQKSKDTATGQDVNVFYHEFVKFGENCDAEFEGKISTFFLREGQDPAEVFETMRREKGINGSPADYAEFTRPFSFDSYITFFKDIRQDACVHKAGETITDPDDLRVCWAAFKSSTDMRRVNGMIEECSYFQFQIEEGCIPKDAPGAEQAGRDKLCEDPNISYSNPDSWKGFGEYEVSESDDEKYDLTIHNLKITAFTLVHALNNFFNSNSNLLHSDLAVTLTTKAIGKPTDTWQTLIAPGSRNDFEEADVRRFKDGLTKENWLESGVNSQFTVGDDDQDACTLGNPLHCRGNFEFDGDRLLHAGEPVDLNNRYRVMLGGLAAFHGTGQLAPVFAREDSSGKGRPLYFTFHGCLHPTEREESGTLKTLDDNAGCYEPHLDREEFTQEYKRRGILTDEDLDVSTDEKKQKSKAYINFDIFDEDRQRYTDYYSVPNHFNHLGGAKNGTKCGRGN